MWQGELGPDAVKERADPQGLRVAERLRRDRPSEKMHPNVARMKRKIAGAPLAHPSGDKRFKMLENAMKRHQHKADALIEVLHTAQELFGCLENDLLLFIAHSLKLPPSRVYGVATFYHYFTLQPKGAHTCVVCMGTACYVKGADRVLSAIEEHAKVKAGGTTADNQLSLLTARCIGACGIAPAVVYDGAVTPRQTPDSALARLFSGPSAGEATPLPGAPPED